MIIKHHHLPIVVTKPSPQKSVDSELSKDEEIERLKREIQKYRLELSNREENFNKIFSEMNPVMVRTGDMSCMKELRTDTARSNEVRVLLPVLLIVYLDFLYSFTTRFSINFTEDLLVVVLLLC